MRNRFNPSRLPQVFDDLEAADFEGVDHAIEQRAGTYDDDEDNQDPDEDEETF